MFTGADRHTGAADDSRPLTGLDLPASMRAAAGQAGRTAADHPLPSVGVAPFALAGPLEISSYVARLTGATGAGGQHLFMDAPFALPRMYGAALFGAAALAAVADAGSIPIAAPGGWPWHWLRAGSRP
jgi:hypothetical protein